jgi:hypothetical protein
MNTTIREIAGKYVAVVHGKTVKRANRSALERIIKRASVEVAETKSESKFTINQRFGFLSDMVTMLAKGDQASVVVTGPGGLGKSHTVSAALASAGMKDLSVLDEVGVGENVPDNAFRVVKGYSTPKGLYRTLYENRNSVVVFDDCDSVLKDPVSLNLLKAALDSYSKRIISWRADFKDEELPNVFEFKGRVVFISNLNSESLDQAIISRSLAVDLSMTAEQKVERMRHLLNDADFMPEYDKAIKQDAMNLIAKLVDSVKELSLRTLIQVTKIRKSSGKNWADLAEYAICG